MKLSIRNRIALYSVLGIASISIVVFIAIYFTVKNIVFSEIDGALKFEAKKHINEVMFRKDSVYFAHKDEWLEREHIEIEVYPLFVELYNTKGQGLDKSPNLRESSLELDLQQENTFISNQNLNGENIRQIQFPLIENNTIQGFIAIAIPLGDAELVIKTLLDTLLFIYPILLVITFFMSRFISQITIKPVTFIAKTVNEISSNNLNKRVPETSNGDELETLSKAINNFLNRIDAAVKREKQFTADASHQLRTPLAILKGNLEVLIRKRREPEQYVEEIKNNINKIDGMSDAVEKLLILARLNSHTLKNLETEELCLYDEIEAILINYKKDILKKGISITLDKSEDCQIQTHKTYLRLVLDNLISNAVKYGEDQTRISISLEPTTHHLKLSICNKGQKIPADEINDIFNPFFRNRYHENTEKGYGLGLAIVAKAIDLLKIKIHVSSDEYTCFSLKIPRTP